MGADEDAPGDGQVHVSGQPQGPSEVVVQSVPPSLRGDLPAIIASIPAESLYLLGRAPSARSGILQEIQRAVIDKARSRDPKEGAMLNIVARICAVVPLTLLVLFAGLAGLITVIWPSPDRQKFVNDLAAKVVTLACVVARTDRPSKRSS